MFLTYVNLIINFQQLFGSILQIDIFRDFNLPGITVSGKFGLYGDAAKDVKAVLLGNLFQMAVAEDFVLAAAVGAFKVTHVLHDTKDGNIHGSGHFHRLFHNHGNQFLGAGHDDDAVQLDGLHHRQRNITGSRRHIDEHIVNVVPDEVMPELLDHAADDGSTPNNRVGIVIQ